MIQLSMAFFIVAVLPVVVIPRATEGIDLEVCDIINESNIPLVKYLPQGRAQGALRSILVNNAREIRVREPEIGLRTKSS